MAAVDKIQKINVPSDLSEGGAIATVGTNSKDLGSMLQKVLAKTGLPPTNAWRTTAGNSFMNQ
jgi:hypothetical protein